MTMFMPGGVSSYECHYKFGSETTFIIFSTGSGSGMFTCSSPSEDQLLPIVQDNRGERMEERVEGEMVFREQLVAVSH